MNDLAMPIGAVRDMPASKYHAIEALSSSGCKKILQSPAHFRVWRSEPSAPTPAMILGSLIHSKILEPQRTAQDFVLGPEVNMRTNAGKAEWAEFLAANPRRQVVDKDQLETANRCAIAVEQHPGARALLADKQDVELSLFWNDAKHGAPCKARLDVRRNDGGIVDVKSTQDASPEAFGKTIANFLYHLQGAFYWSGCEHVFDASPAFYAFIAVETQAPYAVACYVLAPQHLMAGARLADKALERYAAALAAGSWMGYSEIIETAQIPQWALRFQE